MITKTLPILNLILSADSTFSRSNPTDPSNGRPDSFLGSIWGSALAPGKL